MQALLLKYPYYSPKNSLVSLGMVYFMESNRGKVGCYFDIATLDRKI
jgi:hypothetical protein